MSGLKPRRLPGKNKVLFFDTTTDTLVVKLFDMAGVVLASRTYDVGLDLHEQLLPRLAEFLRRHGGFKELAGVAIVPGPGRFTAVRLGVVAANAIGLAQNIPVRAVEKNDLITISKFAKRKKFQPIVPIYGAEPSITMKHDTRNT